MRTIGAAIGLCAAACLSLSWALSYVESSNGLEPPAMEGGRTELEFADINEDGNPDIVSIGDHGNPYVNTDEHGIMVWFGDGQGNWSVYQEGDFGYGGIAAGDVNNDGHLDIGCGMHHNYAQPGQLGAKLIEVGLGNGTGRNWVAWDSGLATHGETWGMFGTDFADVNNDGWLDLASNSFGGMAGVHVYLNYHNGYWDQSFGFTGGMSRDDIVCGDINNDGCVDIAVGQQYGTVYFGDGTGNFTLEQHNLPPPGGQGHSGVALGDVDNDGAKELAFCRGADTIEVYKWNVAGDSWVSLRGSLPVTGYEATQLCDMNCDGYVDLVGFGNGNGTVWLGDEQGNWTQAAGFTTPAPGDFEALRVGGDIDHNGFPDIALVADEATRNHLRCFKEASNPDSLRVTPAFPRGGEKFYSGSVQFIDWLCAVPAGETAAVRLELSTTGPSGPWSLIADSLRNAGRFQWTVPDEPATDCYIRCSASSRHGTSTRATPRPFTILPSTGIGRTGAGQVSRSPAARISPNPARTEARLAYHLPAACYVRVMLCDAAGKDIALLHQGATSPGRHMLPLDTDGLRSGVYFCRLRAGDEERTVKLVLQR
jgi:hypothetical protein